MLSLVRLSIVVAIALAVAAPATQAAQDPFTMTATSYTTGYSPSYVGNGYVGTRIPAAGAAAGALGRVRARRARQPDSGEESTTS